MPTIVLGATEELAGEVDFTVDDALLVDAVREAVARTVVGGAAVVDTGHC